jgi:hypothetical protein
VPLKPWSGLSTVAVMSRQKRIAPIFPVRDLSIALDHYQRLGFTVRTYDKGGYGFATLDGVEIHLGVLAVGMATAPASAYLFVDDADQLAQAWTVAGAQVEAPQDTEWGQHEGVIIDPDGNIIRFGSPMPHRPGKR